PSFAPRRPSSALSPPTKQVPFQIRIGRYPASTMANRRCCLPHPAADWQRSWRAPAVVGGMPRHTGALRHVFSAELVGRLQRSAVVAAHFFLGPVGCTLHRFEFFVHPRFCLIEPSRYA